ncbi:SDR family NAD(P)-dependent oxidoreductase [soil metagenome]
MAIRRALITGASGFIGSHLARSLIRTGWSVVAVGRSNAAAGRLGDIRDQIEFAEADLCDRQGLERAIENASPDVIFHLAADTSVRRFDGNWDAVDRALDTNFKGTLNLVRAAQASGSVKSLIRTGGLEEYGRGVVPSDEEQREEPTSPYSASQTAATHWCQMLQPYLDFSVVTLRPALTYGPGQDNSFLIPALIQALLRGQRFTINSMHRRDYVYIDDLIAAMLLVAARADPLGGRVINISSAKACSVPDVGQTIARLMQKEHLLDVRDAPSPGALETVQGRNDLALKLLNWEPKVGLEEGLQRTIASYSRRL